MQAGQVLAQLDPTFAAADVGALARRYRASRPRSRGCRRRPRESRSPTTGLDPNLALQAAIYGQRKAEFNFKLENYTQKINGLVSAIAKANSDAEPAIRSRLQVATNVEQMRKELEKLQVGSSSIRWRRWTIAPRWSATCAARRADRRQRAARPRRAGRRARRLYAAWHADVSEKLADAASKLSDARESLNKAQLRRQLVELRADRDATVQTVAKVSVGSVLQSGQQFITLVPADAPLEVEANIAGRDDGFVHVGDPVAIKFDTFPFIQYGMAEGTVRTSAPTASRRRTSSATRPARCRCRATAPSRSIGPHRHRSCRPARHAAGFRIDARHAGRPPTSRSASGRCCSYLLGRVMPVASEGMREP